MVFVGRGVSFRTTFSRVAAFSGETSTVVGSRFRPVDPLTTPFDLFGFSAAFEVGAWNVSPSRET